MIDILGGIPGYCAREYGEKTALIFKDRQFSFNEIDTLSNKFGNSLKELGISKGDRVSIYSQNSWEWIISYYAVHKIGGIVNPVNVMLTPEEVLFLVNDCASSALITSPDKSRNMIEIMDKAETLKHVIVYGDEAPSPGIPFDSLLDKGKESLELEAVTPDDISTIGYTSGTTGHPKGAILTHQGVMLNSKLTANTHMKTHEDVVVTSLPSAHVYGNVVMNGTFLTGGTLVLHERFDENEVFESISNHKATMFEGVPAMYIMMLNHSGIDKCDFSAMKKCTVGGQTIGVSVVEEVEKKFGCPLLELWGMTEISGLGTTHPLLGENRHGSIGVALPCCSVKIVDTADANKILGPDAPGEMMIKGPILMKGYYGNEKATQETIEQDGWLHTGDIAYMDADGYVFVVDRLKDMILTGGYNIYPAEIERVLQQHAKVAMVAVGGVKDEVKGELAKAYVVPFDGEPPTEEELIAYCREHLAPYKVPRKLKFVKGLPQTSTGKIMRRKLCTLDE